MLFDILERNALEQEEQRYFDAMDYICYNEVMNDGRDDDYGDCDCDDGCGECDDDWDY